MASQNNGLSISKTLQIFSEIIEGRSLESQAKCLSSVVEASFRLLAFLDSTYFSAAGIVGVIYRLFTDSSLAMLVRRIVSW